MAVDFRPSENQTFLRSSEGPKSKWSDIGYLRLIYMCVGICSVTVFAGVIYKYQIMITYKRHIHKLWATISLHLLFRPSCAHPKVRLCEILGFRHAAADIGSHAAGDIGTETAGDIESQAQRVQAVSRRVTIVWGISRVSCLGHVP